METGWSKSEKMVEMSGIPGGEWAVTFVGGAEITVSGFGGLRGLPTSKRGLTTTSHLPVERITAKIGFGEAGESGAGLPGLFGFDPCKHGISLKTENLGSFYLAEG